MQEDVEERAVNVKAAVAYVRDHNKHPRPFIWTATAVAILRKIKHCKQALETGH